MLSQEEMGSFALTLVLSRYPIDGDGMMMVHFQRSAKWRALGRTLNGR